MDNYFTIPSTLKHCPNGTEGLAFWTCDYYEWIGKSPDFSGCITLDLEDFNSQLNKTDSNPSEVISDVNTKLEADGTDISAGDVIGLIELVDNSIAVGLTNYHATFHNILYQWHDFFALNSQVQSQRISEQPKEEQEEYANTFTNSSIELLDNILADPVPWIGLQDVQRTEQLSKIQKDLDEIASSLIQYSRHEESWDYQQYSGNYLMAVAVVFLLVISAKLKRRPRPHSPHFQVLFQTL